MSEKSILGSYHKEESVQIDPEVYGRFLDLVSRHFTIKPVREYAEPGDKICLLRHDVDAGGGGGLWGAMKMGAIEHKQGIRSTYYMVHNVRYYRDNRIRLISKSRQLQRMGHEVGFHNDILSVCLNGKSSHTPEHIFKSELDFLTSGGVYISGVSSHGSHFARSYGVFNTQIFKECQPTDPEDRSDNVNGVPLNTIQLSDYGLYETSLILLDYYISDSGGNWRTTERRKLVFPVRNHDIDPNDFEEYMEKLGEDDDVNKIMILTHPGVWYRERFKAFRLPFGGL